MKINSEQEIEIIKLYDTLSVNSIAKKYDVSRQYICLILEKNKIKRDKHNLKIKDTDTNNIIKLYNNNEKIKNISLLYNVCSNTILNILHKNNIQIRDNNWEQKKYKLNRHYFDMIDSEDKAYFLGLLYADGCNTGENIQISLAGDDSEILNKISKNFYFNERPLLKNELSKENINHQDRFTLVISDQKILKSFEKWGIIGNKTFRLDYPQFLNNDLFNHFLRGCFDGDGSVFLSKGYINVSIVGYKELLEKLKIKIETILNIEMNLYPKSNNKTYELITSNMLYVKHIYDFMYKNSNYYLDRKYNIFKSYFNNKEIKRTSLYKGVSYSKVNGNWQVKFYDRINKKTIYIGTFKNEKDAIESNKTFLKNKK